MSKSSGHKIADYNAKDDIVICVCGFNGTADEFHAHKSPKGTRKHNTSGTLDFLGRLPLARLHYHKQGSLTGVGKRYGRS